jgi:hypothetical protein
MREHTTPPSRRHARSLTSAAVLLLTIIGLGACQRTALRPDDTRSQFDRYDQARSQRAQPFLEDEFGRRTPNLKERLLVSDE